MSVKQLRGFLGMLQYYQDMWRKHSQLLAPLIDLVSKCRHTKVTRAKKTKTNSWHWDKIHQEAFDKIKKVIAGDVTLAYTDYSQPFEIFMDASSTQLGAVIVQNGQVIAYFSRNFLKPKYSIH